MHDVAFREFAARETAEWNGKHGAGTWVAYYPNRAHVITFTLGPAITIEGRPQVLIAGHEGFVPVDHCEPIDLKVVAEYLQDLNRHVDKYKAALDRIADLPSTYEHFESARTATKAISLAKEALGRK